MSYQWEKFEKERRRSVGIESMIGMGAGLIVLLIGAYKIAQWSGQYNIQNKPQSVSHTNHDYFYNGRLK